MNEEAEKAMAQLVEDAEKVALDFMRQINAKLRKSRAEDELLRAIVGSIKPALPAVSSRVGGLSGPLARALALGVMVEGSQLFLSEQGDFFLLSGPQCKPVVLSSEQVLDRVPLDAVFAPIVSAVRAQLGRKRNVEEIEREAHILEGIAQALKVGGALR